MSIESLIVATTAIFTGVWFLEVIPYARWAKVVTGFLWIITGIIWSNLI